jgi:hypothetical protein
MFNQSAQPLCSHSLRLPSRAELSVRQVATNKRRGARVVMRAMDQAQLELDPIIPAKVAHDDFLVLQGSAQLHQRVVVQ